jgi:hypothetical protein
VLIYTSLRHRGILCPKRNCVKTCILLRRLHLIERTQTEEQELLKTETNNRSILSTIEMIKFKIICAVE